MKPSEYKKFVTSRFEAGIMRPIYVTSEPGVGKTQISGQVARDLSEAYDEDIGFLSIHAPTLMPEDVALPVPSADRTSVNFVVTTDMLPFESSDVPDRGILLIDELPQGSTDTQKLLAHVMQERNVHGHPLKPGWFIVATGNRQQDRAGANRILSHLGNRMTHIQLDANLDDWVSWFVEQPYYQPVCAAFLRFRPELFTKFDASQPVSPTPRAWSEGVFASMSHLPPGIEMEAFTGDVGEGAAAEFASFLSVYRDLPDIDKILANPSKAPVPDRTNVLYALTGALGARVNKKNIQAVLDYMSRLPQEFTVMLLTDVIRRDEEITETPAFAKWFREVGEDLLC